MPARRTGFFDLPFEIRAKVYSLTFPTDPCRVVLKPADGYTHWDRRSQNSHTLDVEITGGKVPKLHGQVARVCRQMYEDVQPFIYLAKTFVVGQPQDAYFILLCQKIRHRNRRMVKRLEISFGDKDTPLSNKLFALKHNVVQVFTQLEELIILELAVEGNVVWLGTSQTAIQIVKASLPQLSRVFINDQTGRVRFVTEGGKGESFEVWPVRTLLTRTKLTSVQERRAERTLEPHGLSPEESARERQAVHRMLLHLGGRARTETPRGAPASHSSE